MFTLQNIKLRRNSLLVRCFLMIVVIAGVVASPLRLPNTTPVIEAGCFTEGPALSEIVTRVTACPATGSGVDVTFALQSHVGLNGSCLDAHVSFTGSDNGTGSSPSNFVIHLSPTYPSNNINFNFRLNTYPNALPSPGAPWYGDSKKVLGGLTVPGGLSSCTDIF